MIKYINYRKLKELLCLETWDDIVYDNDIESAAIAYVESVKC